MPRRITSPEGLKRFLCSSLDTVAALNSPRTLASLLPSSFPPNINQLANFALHWACLRESRQCGALGRSLAFHPLFSLNSPAQRRGRFSAVQRFAPENAWRFCLPSDCLRARLCIHFRYIYACSWLIASARSSWLLLLLFRVAAHE